MDESDGTKKLVEGDDLEIEDLRDILVDMHKALGSIVTRLAYIESRLSNLEVSRFRASESPRR